MRSPGINGERELRGGGQLANPGSPGKMAFKRSVCVLFATRWLGGQLGGCRQITQRNRNNADVGFEFPKRLCWNNKDV